VAAKEPTRYALQRVLLRGRTGEVVATDGKQLLVQAGFPLPWRDDALVPRLAAWGSRELPREGPVAAGRTDAHVHVRAGPWTLALAVERGARYPPFEGVLPRPGTAAGTLRLAKEDLATLARELPGLGGPAARQAPVTLDLGAAVAVRTRGEAPGSADELVLAGSAWSGPPARVALHRAHLLLAARLGFAEAELHKPDQPVVFRAPSRLYVLMPLPPDAAHPPPAGAPEAATDCIPPATVPDPDAKKDTPAMPTPTDNGRHAGRGDAGRGDAGTPSPAPFDPLAEAEAVRGLLAEAQARAGRLVAALKQHRRSARALEAAVASLRQLPPLSP
jgi:hypothetical protein